MQKSGGTKGGLNDRTARSRGNRICGKREARNWIICLNFCNFVLKKKGKKKKKVELKNCDQFLVSLLSRWILLVRIIFLRCFGEDNELFQLSFISRPILIKRTTKTRFNKRFRDFIVFLQQDLSLPICRVPLNRCSRHRSLMEDRNLCEPVSIPHNKTRFRISIKFLESNESSHFVRVYFHRSLCYDFIMNIN